MRSRPETVMRKRMRSYALQIARPRGQGPVRGRSGLPPQARRDSGGHELMKIGGFWLAVMTLLGAMAAIEYVTARDESQTYDESNQLLSGYAYLTTGRFAVALEHPPLAKLLWALPVSLLHPDAPPKWIDPADPWPAGRTFLYRNRVPADSMLLAGRSCAIFVSVLLGVAIALWTRRYFGALPALGAVFLYAADPNFLANGRYMKNDVAAALAIFAAVMTWGAYLMRARRWLLWLSGGMLGLALSTKSSALILLPVMAILFLIRRWQQRQPAFGGVRCFAVAGLAAYLTIFAVYGFELKPIGESGAFRWAFPGARMAARIPVPAFSYFRGLGGVGLMQSGRGLASGSVLAGGSHFSRWYVSPLAFAVKTPLAALLLFALAAAIAVSRARHETPRNVDFRWFLFGIPPAVYFVVSLACAFNAGLRHLLPLYPFLFALAASLLLSPPVPRWRTVAIGVAAMLLMVETAAVHPHYLAFFNALAGGPAGGRRFLVDSNLDWGQDVKNLKRYLDNHGIREVSIDYFGMADLAYYGIRSSRMPEIPDVSAARRLDRVVAISVTNLALKHNRYAGLDALQPAAQIGYSILLYDLRKLRAPRSE